MPSYVRNVSPLDAFRVEMDTLLRDTALYHAKAHRESIAAPTLPVVATNQATALALANGLRAAMLTHWADAHQHTAADARTITAPVATDASTTYALLNELKTDHNAHNGDAKHPAPESATDVSTTDASDEETAVALANAIRTAFLAHVAHAVPGSRLILTEP